MPNLIDSHVNVKQTKLAINALLDHAAKVQAKREETELLGARDELVWLNVNVKRVHPEKKLKPFSIPLARPIIDPRTSPICLITKDPQREYKDLLAAQNIKFISRVVGVTKLKGKFKPFEARRQLLKDHRLFLADDRVVPLLPKLLGKMFFDAKKQPTPVNLQRKDLKAELERAVSSTYMHQNQGTCTSIKIAPISFTPGQVLENLTTALPHIVKHIKGGWDNVQSLNIKTSTSVSLPIWSCDLGSGEGGRWAGMTAPSEESATTSESEEEEEESVIKEGKKRAAPIAPARETNKKAKSDSAEVTKPTNATTAAPTKPKTTPVAATTKAVSIAAPPPAKKLAKNAIPQTPVVEESDSEGEPTPAPRSVSNAKKRAVVAGVDLKKAKILATKGSLRKGSKAKILGSK